MQEKLLSDRCMGCGLDSRGGVPPLGRRRSKLSTGQFLCTASVQVLSISRPKKEIPEWVSLFFGANGDTELFEKASNINGFGTFG